jgi:hypothetical protein
VSLVSLTLTAARSVAPVVVVVGAVDAEGARLELVVVERPVSRWLEHPAAARTTAAATNGTARRDASG